MSSPIQKQPLFTSNPLTLSSSWENYAKMFEDFRLLKSGTVPDKLGLPNYDPPKPLDSTRQTLGSTDWCDIKEQNEPFDCKICGKRLSQRPALYNHMRTHSDIRPFKCSCCSATFKWKPCLKTHMKLHQLKKEVSTNQWVEDLAGLTYTTATGNKTTTGKIRRLPYSRQNKEKKAQSDSKTVSRQQKSSVPTLQANLHQPLKQRLVQNQMGQNQKNFTQFYSGHSEYQKIGTTSKLDGSIVMMTPIKLENRTPNIQTPVNYSTFSPIFQHGLQEKLHHQIHSYASELAKTYYSSLVNSMMNQQYCLKLNTCQLNNNNHHQEFI